MPFSRSRHGCTKRIATATSAPAAWRSGRTSDYGSNVVTSFEVVGMGDLTKQMKFISPDDGNPDDKTVFQVKLPRPVAPGQDVTFKITFKAKFPEVIARTGYKRTFLLAGQWFPKVGVWWHGQWNCHQFHAMTEFFADFGTYDVKVTLPKDYVIGATGVQVAEQDNGNGTKTVGFHAEDVHDFAWTADPNFKVINEHLQRQRRRGEDSPAQLRQPRAPVAALHHVRQRQHEEVSTNGTGRIRTRSSRSSIRRTARRKPAAWSIPRSLPATAAGTSRRAFT